MRSFCGFKNSVVEKIKSTGVRVIIFLYLCYSIYADNILPLAPSVSALQILLAACDEELTRLGMQINEKVGRYACGLVHALTRTVKTSSGEPWCQAGVIPM